MCHEGRGPSGGDGRGLFGVLSDRQDPGVFDFSFDGDGVELFDNADRQADALQAIDPSDVVFDDGGDR